MDGKQIESNAINIIKSNSVSYAAHPIFSKTSNHKRKAMNKLLKLLCNGDVTLLSIQNSILHLSVCKEVLGI